MVALGRWILGEVSAVVEDSRREVGRGVKLCVQLRLIQNHTHREPCIRNLNSHKTDRQIIRRHGLFMVKLGSHETLEHVNIDIAVSCGSLRQINKFFNSRLLKLVIDG